MNVSVRYFANMRDKMGKAEDALSFDGGDDVTVNDVWKRVSPDSELPSNLLIAVNMEYTDGGHQLKDGDEVAFFPPVTGG